MKNKLLRVMLTVALSISLLAGCSSSSEVIENVSTAEETSTVQQISEEEQVTEKETVQEVTTSEAEAEKTYKDDGIVWQEFLADMGMGWNLGNTFDAIDCSWLKDKIDYETGWLPESNRAKTSKEMIKLLKDSGFNTVRIPVSWHNHVQKTKDADGNKSYIIDSDWMERVKEVVDYCIEENMYVIINIHHDDKTDLFIYPTEEYKNQSIRYITDIWTQIATEFADYDTHLIYETFNEVRLTGTEDEWNAKSVNSQKAQLIMNEYAQAAVNAIRAVDKGYNESRFIFVPGYAASLDSHEKYVLPTDPGEYQNRIGVAIHAYTPYNFCMDKKGTSEYNQQVYASLLEIFRRTSKYFTANDIPAYIGEWGVISKEDNDESRITYARSWAEVSQTTCKDSEKNIVKIPTVLWDNGFLGNANENERYGYMDRVNVKWFDNAQGFIEAIMEGKEAANQ